MSDIISIKGLEKTYVTSGEQLTILKNLDWNLPSGVKAVITGASGSGKSTFLNILSGIDSATGGSIHAPILFLKWMKIVWQNIVLHSLA